MSSVNIIASIIVLLAALVCYAFVAQTLRQKREQRKRVLTALKARSRSFKFMINGFPEGFLPRELTLLVQRCLIDVSEQLAKLEPREPSHMQDLQSITTQMTETQRTTKPNKPVALESTQQIKEVKICLEELYRFIHHQESKSAINKGQADNYRNQIKILTLQLTVDSYVAQGKAAAQASKIKLAAHYYDLALKLIAREARPGQFDQRVASLKTTYRQLMEQLTTDVDGDDHQPADEAEQAEQEDIADEWDKFDSDEGSWKKKHVYD